MCKLKVLYSTEFGSVINIIEASELVNFSKKFKILSVEVY